MGKKRIITKAETEVQDPAAAAGASKRGAKKQVLNAIAHINVSYNNTLIAISDMKGDILSFSSAGLLGFKGTKKSTPYAANMVAKDVVEKAKRFNVANLKIIVKGIGPARESSIRGLAGTGLHITSIMDETPVAHNGVKAKKPRRV